VTNFPGLCLPETAHPNYYAVQTLAYLQLSTGPHRFHVDSDDAVAIYSGTNLLDTSRALLSSDAVTHADIDFVAPADGLYPFNIIMEEGNGDAYLCLYSVNLINGVQSLINTNNGDVKAFYPLVVKSSTSVKAGSTWTVVTSTNVPTTVASSPCGTLSGVSRTVTGGTSTIANSGAPKYYRLEGPRSTRITGLVPSGSNVGIVYQAP
jgi:hypothetical protein